MRFWRFLAEKSVSILPETSIAESLLPSSSFTNFKLIVHLVSGSDVASGHVDNIFQARIVPFTDDRTIVTSAADGQEDGIISESSFSDSRNTVMIKNIPNK
ncbi:unnamed protein product [Lactuca virosa]|uniref:Uncharacterized protein n=1 Tax=Lactuca virosa TaxID=75947 RepID=A0AAU9M169_9ASTR|nr:unnamed protein product [Lactuca virosa]